MNANITNTTSETTLTINVDFNQILDDNGIVRILTNSDSSKGAEEGLCKEFGISEITANYILNMPLSKLTSLTQTSIKSELEKYMACVTNIR